MLGRQIIECPLYDYYSRSGYGFGFQLLSHTKPLIAKDAVTQRRFMEDKCCHLGLAGAIVHVCEDRRRQPG